MNKLRTVGYLAGTGAIASLAAVVGWILFVWLPGGSMTRLLGIVMVVGLGAVAAKVASKFLSVAFPTYDVAEIVIEGKIGRQSSGLPISPTGTSAEEVVKLVEQAEARNGIDALIVRMNTNGGEVLPSEDIRRAVSEFDGPTVAYITDTCASGGYWIATGCDAIYARRQSMIGSIGVTGSKVNAFGLIERLGLSYLQFTAGEYKDAGNALKNISSKERQYLQGIVDGYYEQFVDRVTEGRSLDQEIVRETEARMYLAPEALDLGLIDEIGARNVVKAAIADELDRERVSVHQISPDRGLTERLAVGTQQLCYAFGVGVATVVGSASIHERIEL